MSEYFSMHEQAQKITNIRRGIRLQKELLGEFISLVEREAEVLFHSIEELEGNVSSIQSILMKNLINEQDLGSPAENWGVSPFQKSGAV